MKSLATHSLDNLDTKHIIKNISLYPHTSDHNNLSFGHGGNDLSKETKQLPANLNLFLMNIFTSQSITTFLAMRFSKRYSDIIIVRNLA